MSSQRRQKEKMTIGNTRKRGEKFPNAKKQRNEVRPRLKRDKGGKKTLNLGFGQLVNRLKCDYAK